MKTKTLFIFFFFLPLFAFSQGNLVPNFSFEIYDTCPDAQDQIERATGWQKASAANTTPDYYNSCASSGFWSVPNGGNVYQHEFRNCSAYAGIVTLDNSVSPYREHIIISLTSTLIVGQKYYISFITVMGEVLIGNNYFGFPSNNIGLKLSTILYSKNNPVPIDNFSHLRAINIINDSINWTRVSGSFIADSAYNYIIVGNFYDNFNTDSLHFTCSTCLNHLSYYVIDDICLSTDSLLCNGAISSLPCLTSINENSNKEMIIFPNPVKDYLNLLYKQEKSLSIYLFNLLGEMILESNLIKNKSTLSLESLTSGIYIVKIFEGDELKLTTKILKL